MHNLNWIWLSEIICNDFGIINSHTALRWIIIYPTTAWIPNPIIWANTERQYYSFSVSRIRTPNEFSDNSVKIQDNELWLKRTLSGGCLSSLNTFAECLYIIYPIAYVPEEFHRSSHVRAKLRSCGEERELAVKSSREITASWHLRLKGRRW